MKKYLFILAFLWSAILLTSCESKLGNKNCNVCHGSGLCSTCYGSGTESICSSCYGAGYTTSTCPSCHGLSGGKCWVCGGSGKIYDHMVGFTMVYRDCSSCNGTGYDYCATCNSTGTLKRSCSSCNGGSSKPLCHTCGGSGKCISCGGSSSVSGGSSSGGNDYSPSDHEGDSRYCKYVGSANGYTDYGDRYSKVTIYIYRTQPGGTERASFADPTSAGYILESATEKIYTGKDPWGLGCNKYIMPLGVKSYFKW